MRKINRDNLPPVNLYVMGTNTGFSKWRVSENNVIRLFQNDPISFNNGVFVFPAHPSYDIWKKELVNIQGQKCCFCEKPIKNGAIEHYRPKKGWQQNVGDPITRPGYYWLAYRWKNLLLSCSDCNESGQKGNLFPIDGIRALVPTSNLNLELARLINPYEEDPSTFISFYKSDPISLHPKGNATIQVLKLKDRADIKEIRRDKFDLYSLAVKVAKLPAPNNTFTQDDINEAKERVRSNCKPKKPFSGMIIENIKNGHIVL